MLPCLATQPRILPPRQQWGRHPLFPERLVRYPLRTDRMIGDVKCPILLVHGTHDELIPIADSEVLLTLAKKAELMRIDGAAHGNIHEFPACLHWFETKLKQVGAALR